MGFQVCPPLNDSDIQGFIVQKITVINCKTVYWLTCDPFDFLLLAVVSLGTVGIFE